MPHPAEVSLKVGWATSDIPKIPEIPDFLWTRVKKLFRISENKWQIRGDLGEYLVLAYLNVV